MDTLHDDYDVDEMTMLDLLAKYTNPGVGTGCTDSLQKRWPALWARVELLRAAAVTAQQVKTEVKGEGETPPAKRMRLLDSPDLATAIKMHEESQQKMKTFDMWVLGAS